MTKKITQSLEEQQPAVSQKKERMVKDADGTITFNLSIPQEDIKKTWEEEVIAAVNKATLPGFREGKAPREIVEPRLDTEKIREEVLKKLLPKYYVDAVNEFSLKPIINPKVHVERIDDGTDWEFHAITCEMPEVKLNDYKEKVKEITAKSKIIIPGKEEQQPDFDAIMKAILEAVTLTVPAVLVEGEVERLLSQLLNEVKSLGLSLEQYLGSAKKTPEELQKENTEKATNDIEFEFVLQKIADEEKLTVTPQEVQEAMAKAKDDVERKQLEGNVYLLANILRQQKTLDFLRNL